MALNVWVVKETLSHEQFAALARQDGWTLVLDEPWTHGWRSSQWERAGETVLFEVETRSGAGVLRASPTVIPKVPAFPTDELINANPATPLEQLRHLGCCAAVVASQLEPERFLREMASYLMSPEPLVRWEAARGLVDRPVAAVAEQFREAVTQFPDLEPDFLRYQARLASAEEGTLFDAPTDDFWTLMARAREGAAKNQWKRVAVAINAALEEFPDQLEALALRAEAHFGLGEIGLAAAWVGAFREEQRCQKKAHEGMQPDNFSFADPALEARVEALWAKIAKTPLDALPAEVEERLVQWVEADELGLAVGAAKVLESLCREPSVLFDWLIGFYYGEVERLQRVAAAVPDFAEVWVELAKRSDESHYARARTLLKGERSPEVERLYRLIKAPTTEVDIVSSLARRAYEAEDWQRAWEFGDELVTLDPNSTYGWQIRANARTFGLRHPEAVLAYRDALEFLQREKADTAWFGDNPAEALRFNLSCVLAKLGRREEALEALRVAVNLNEKWSADAQTDDYFESLWEDEEFLAICAGDPLARIPTAERTEEVLGQKLRFGSARIYRGEAEEAVALLSRASGIAAWLDQPGPRSKALSLLGRAYGMLDRTEESEQSLDEAVAIAGDPRVSPGERAEVLNERAIGHHRVGRWEQAEAGYLEAMALRRLVHGDASPLLAKSYGELTRLSVGRGDAIENAFQYLAPGIQLLEAYLKTAPTLEAVPVDDDRLEAQADLAHLRLMRGRLLLSQGRSEEALSATEALMDCLEAIAAEKGSASASVEAAAESLLETLAVTPAVDPVRLSALQQRAFALKPGSPEERVERQFWREVRRRVQSVRARGVPDTEIAGQIREVLRSGTTAFPEFEPLVAGFALRVERVSSFLVFTAMSLEMAQTGLESLDAAIENLEEIAVGGLYEEE